MRRVCRVDDNQKLITAALRKLGCTVQPLHQLGQGVPDLLVGFNGANYLLEVKDGNKPPSKRQLSSDEQLWHENWCGQVAVVKSVEDAVRALGLPE